MSSFLPSAGIYVHIPFCVSRCFYCDFLSTTYGEEIQKKYFSILQKEISGSPFRGRYHIVSVFFGGGTPSLPESELLADTLSVIRSCFETDENAEITIECNPGTLDEKKLSAYRQAGINRLSIGLQSADNRMLRKLGRIHSYETFEKEWNAARSLGFSNMSVDLIYGLPGQTRNLFRDTINKVLNLKSPPQHISAYSLIIEKGTPFWDRYHEDAERKKLGDHPLFLPSEEEESFMLSDMKNLLTEAGYHRYEISNWAKDGFESLHNKGYWERREYIGFGLGASGQTGHTRWKNTTDLTAYLAEDAAGRQETLLTKKEEIEETMFLGLREMRGVSRQDFQRRFGVNLDDLYRDVLKELSDLKLLEDDGRSVRLTDRGIEISNPVLAEFLLD